MGQPDFPILSTITAVPIIGAALVFGLGNRKRIREADGMRV